MRKSITQNFWVCSLFFILQISAFGNLVPWKKELTKFSSAEPGKFYLTSKNLKERETLLNLKGYRFRLNRDGFSIFYKGAPVLETQEKAFFIAANKNPKIKSNRFGAVYLKAKLGRHTCHEQTIHSFSLRDQKITMKGNLYGKDCFIPYTATFQVDDDLLKIRLEGKKSNQSLWLGLNLPSNPSSPIYGGGEQFTKLNLKGSLIPFMAQEQGHGRGSYWTSLPFDIATRGLSGGDQFSTYIPVVSFFTKQKREYWNAYKLRGPSYSLFDFREPSALRLWSLSESLQIEIMREDHPLKMVQKISHAAGLPHPTPDWFHEGVVVGGFLEGEEKVYELLKKIEDYNIPTKAMWIEDWSGIDRTFDGSRRLKWNWEVDRTLYPHWESMVAAIKERGIRIGGYLNPLARELKAEDARHHDLNMYEYLKEKSYLIKNFDSEVFADLGFIKAYFVDLLNPDAYQELMNILKKYMIPAGIQFWNADFSEALPLQTNYVLRERDGMAIRHKFITKWAQFNRELINQHMNGDAVAFIRSGHTESLQYNQMYWQGDQMTTFDENDGLKSTTIAGITSGLSGILINHSDVGGAIKFSAFGIKRSKELMHRWMEKETFGALLRTKEGMGTLKLSLLEDEELLTRFSQWSQVFSKLFPYRKSLYQEAQKKGIPIIRALFLHYPDDPNTYELDDQFLFGKDMLVAPVHNEEKVRTLYLPKGHWTHFLTGKEIFVEQGKWIKIGAPIGCPAVFYKKENLELQTVAKEVKFLAPQNCPIRLGIKD